MLKRLSLALAGLFALVAVAHGAGTVPGFSLTPQFDKLGKVAPGCRLYVIQAGTTSAPQNPYQDSGLTVLAPNPLTCDATGRLPQWFVADGTIKLRQTDKNGVQLFEGDNLLVVGASSGGGGGSPVDPTTVIATGDLKARYGVGVLSGFVRANGRTIGSATSGATERANLDCQSLFEYLWGADANLAVSGGRGVSANADWVANKTLTLPDWRGRALAFLDDMGNSAAGRLTATYFGTAATVLGAASTGLERRTLLTANLPPYTPQATSITLVSNTSSILQTNSVVDVDGSAGGAKGGATGTTGVSSISSTLANGGSFVGTAQGGLSTPVSIIPPTLLATIYMKL